MQPFEAVTGGLAVSLAAPSEVYVTYLPHGGKASVDMAAHDGSYSARWYNPRDGKWGEEFDVNGGSTVGFVALNDHDWTLLLRRK